MAVPEMIHAEQLTKTYGSLVALREFSLTVNRGEILALVGPNGAGKTTALKLLVGLLAPSAGRVAIAGFDMQRQALEAKRVLAFLPDQPFLYEQLTIAETLGFIGGMYQLAPARFRELAGTLLETFGLAAFLHHRVGPLSFGMKSRLVLLISLLHEPQVLIMDEPFFGLDPSTLRLIKQLLTERAAHGMTVLMSTHQLSIVEDLAHRIGVLHQGQLVALGTMQELRQRYGEQRLEALFFQLTSSQGS